MIISGHRAYGQRVVTVRTIHRGNTSIIPGPVALAKGFIVTVDASCCCRMNLHSVQHAEHQKYDVLHRFSSEFVREMSMEGSELIILFVL